MSTSFKTCESLTLEQLLAELREAGVNVQVLEHGSHKLLTDGTDTVCLDAVDDLGVWFTRYGLNNPSFVTDHVDCINEHDGEEWDSIFEDDDEPDPKHESNGRWDT